MKIIKSNQSQPAIASHTGGEVTPSTQTTVVIETASTPVHPVPVGNAASTNIAMALFLGGAIAILGFALFAGTEKDKKLTDLAAQNQVLSQENLVMDTRRQICAEILSQPYKQPATGVNP